MRIWALLLMLATTAHAGPWGLDVGLLAGVGPGGFVGQPAGLDPTTFFFPPKVTASAPLGLVGSVGADFSLHYKRRWTISLQPQWQGRSLVMDETLDLLGTELKRQTLWEWQSVHLPLSLHYSRPIARGEGWALLARGGAGLWWSSIQNRRKQLSSGTGTPLERPWAGPANDVGPMLALGLDWLNLPKGSKAVGFEVRFERGVALQDREAGAGLPVWAVQGVLVVPIWLKVL